MSGRSLQHTSTAVSDGHLQSMVPLLVHVGKEVLQLHLGQSVDILRGSSSSSNLCCCRFGPRLGLQHTT